MRIYSGECEHGECGVKTPYFDTHDEPLFVGDIVSVSTSDQESGITTMFGLSVVVECRPKLTGKTEDTGPFIMGIAKVEIGIDEKWYIRKVKDWSDCIDGEHWKDYGFNYKEDK